MPTFDHLLYGVPDLEAGIAHIEARVGVRPKVGGRHPELGTHNALLSLGDGAYLELIAPDPPAPEPRPRPPFRLDALTAPRCVSWVARTRDLGGVVAHAERLGVSLGLPRAGSRRRPDGTVLRWRITDPDAERLDGMLPFFIDWGDTPHPSAGAPAGCTLASLRGEHPDPERVHAVLSGLGLELDVTPAPAPALVATLRTPRGDVELR